MQIFEKHYATKKNHHSLSIPLANGGQKQFTDDYYSGGKIDKFKEILVFLPKTGIDDAIRNYGEYLSTLLNGQTSYFSELSSEPEKCLNQDTRDCDLILIGQPQQSALERALFGSLERRVVGRASASLVVVQTPLWPIRKILLVLRVQSQESLAVDWAGYISHSSGAELTIQPIVPAQPLIYGPGSRLHVGIDSLLAPGTRCGDQLRIFLDQLKQWQVNGTLRVRQGDPLWQILAEIEEGEYDLIIIATEQHSRLLRWLFGELVGPLFSMVSRPILVASLRQPGKQSLNHGQIGEKGGR